ncbi:MAG: 30S ribosomal protein S17 [Halobacteriovoraceae bacterium]|nr:30S ribosomal protein S17 [Halobacteriovoraceae bacterium]
MSTDVKKFKRRLTGEVVSNANDKTIVVNVARRYKHPKYSKFVTKTKKYHAHDEKNEANVGDTVTIIESTPFSKLKKWQLMNIR